MCDTGFSGICAASGRNPLIRKKRFYVRSVVDGVIWGNVACAVGAVIYWQRCYSLPTAQWPSKSPLTVAGPVIIVVGIGGGLVSARPGWSVILASLFIAAMMIPFRQFLKLAVRPDAPIHSLFWCRLIERWGGNF